MKQLSLLALVFAGLAASAQDVPMAMGDYNKLSIPKFGIIKLTFDGQLELLGDGVEIRLVSDKPEVKELPIKAQTITFDYTEGATSPTRIVMEGSVYIEHPQATVKAQKAEWDFNKGTLIFTGKPVVSNAMVKEMQAESVTIDFNAGTLQATHGRLDEYQLNNPGAGGGTTGPHGISEGAISDWPGFLDALKAQAKAEGASPGKQIVAQLKKDQQSQLMNTNTDALVANKGLIVKLLNGVLKSPALYSEAAWKGLTLGDEAKALLAKDKRTEEEQMHLNRLLLQAAFPNFIKAG